MSVGGNVPDTGRELFRDVHTRLAFLERALRTKASQTEVNVLDKYVDQILAEGTGNTYYSVVTDVGVPYPTWEDPLPFGVIALEGQDLPRVGQYAPLFAVWGTRFGVGDGSTTFGVPDMRGKGLMGYFSGDADFGTLGQEGGEREHTLTEAEMPSHSHGVTTRAGGVGNNGAVVQRGYLGSSDIGSQSTTSTGGGESHNVLDPYITARWVARYQTVTAPPAGSLAAVAATPDTVALRDGNGNFSVADPVDATHAATKGYVDTLNGSGYQLGSGVDLDDLTAPGNYFQHNNGNAATGSNYPIPVAGMLEVRAQDDGAFIYQRYTVYRGYESRTFVRNWYSGSWDDWREYADVTKRTLSPATFGSIASGFTFVDFSGYVRSGILSFELRVSNNSAISVNTEGDLANTTIWNLGSSVRPADYSHSLTSGRSGRVYSGCAYRDSGDLQITAAAGAGNTIEAGETITLGGTWVLD